MKLEDWSAIAMAVTASIVMLCMLATASPAAADDIDDACSTLAETVSGLAKARDAGVSEDAVSAFVTDLTAADPEVQSVIVPLVAKVYDNPDLSPGLASYAAYSACVEMFAEQGAE